MIQFEDVSKAFAGDLILEGVSFKVNKGERCGLVGRNGSGKTTILRMITHEESPDSGSISMPKGYKLGYLSQHLKFTQETLLEEAALGLSSEYRNDLYKVEKVLFGLGFKEEDLEAPLSKFSGGYQLRVHLTKVIVSEPDCLLLDEPTNYLDIVSIRWLTKFLQQWRGELIVISHDRDFMDSVTTHTLGVHRKKVSKYEGGTEKFYEQLLQAEYHHENARIALEKKRAHLESYIKRFGAKASKATQAQARVKALEKMPVLEELAKLHNLDFEFPYAPYPGAKLLETKEVCFSYNSDFQIIENLSLIIEPQDRIAVIGKNGRGKSTLLKLLAQDLEPQKGEIKVGVNVRMGFFGQTNIERLNPHLTIEEEIGSSSAQISYKDVRRICGLMMFSSDRAKKKIGVLSGGEKSRVLLGKILVSPCNLLLLDEPTNHLDMESIEALVTALEVFEGSVVIVTHSERILRRLPTKFIICHQGEQHLFLGDYEEFLAKEGWERGEKKREEGSSKKEDEKRKKSDSVAMRAKVLKPIQKQIEILEKEITQLEGEIERESQALIEASQKAAGALIGQLSRSINEKRRATEELFDKLDALTQYYEKTKAEWNDKS